MGERKSSKNVEKQTDPELIEKEIEQIGIVQPPDGGYGWVIVVASFLINMIVDGVIFTVGKILLPAWVEGFKISESSASLTMSILSGCYFFIGPFSSALCNVFGCRKVAIAGAVISCIGFLLSIPAPNIYCLYITFGLIGGAGLGMMYLPAIVIISQYFAVRRSLATGIAVCGSGIGTTVFALLNDIVYEFVKGDWRQFLVYTATIAISGFVASILLRPLKASKTQIEKVVQIVEDYEEKKEKISDSPTVNHKYNTPLLSTMEMQGVGKHNNQLSGSATSIIDAVTKDIEDLNRPLSRMDVFYTGSTANLHTRSRTNTLNREDVEEALEHAKEAREKVFLSKLDLNEDVASLGGKRSVKADIIQALRNLLDSSLLASPSFLTLAFSGTLTLSCFYVPFIYLGKHLDKIPDLTLTQKSFPVSLIGIINIIARIGCGYIADRPEVSALLVNNIALIFAGIATFTVPWYTEYWHFLIFCVPFAIGVACFAALRSIICLELIGLEKLSNAFGILLTFMGVGAIIGAPIAAALKDLTGNFDTSFYIMGSLMALSGLVCIPLPMIRRWENNRNEKKKDAKSDVELEGLTAST
ncbi:unnamed protein product [Caenorhabditis bovis]|uniref:Major facilitator superfamily (MFS) profile domain-containing protein n=1 Tax=Caenorhabditis bovis TaxID=2654633 RepID=A0A8S1EJV0_9PELO|nr:unnamed protein product [Caenorhabditis bovis]